MTSSSTTGTEVKRNSRLCKVNPRYFSLHWRSSDTGESTADNSTKSKSNEITSDISTDEKKSNSFFKSIRKKWSLKNFHKSKRKSSMPSSSSDPAIEKTDLPSSVKDDESLDVNQSNKNIDSTQEHADQTYLEAGILVNNTDENTTTGKSTQPNGIDTKESQSTLSQELLKLSKYGWYWGPMSGDQADALLLSEPDGAFLIRDSSDDRHLLTLSFKSAGKMLHARVEHSGGMFSLCNQGESGRFPSVPALVDHSMDFSKYSVFCYSRPRYPGYPAFPVRLTKPVSRFNQVRSLQYLCRFVIRQNTRRDNIHKLPLPKTIKGYVEEDYY